MTKRTIVIVEDDPASLGILTLLFEGAGWRVGGASDGRAGLGLARSLIPDVVVTDLRMPRMSGIAMARAMADCDDLCGLPILGITSAGSRMRRAAEQTGLFAAIMAKPLHPRAILQAVTRAIPRSRQVER